MPSDRGMITDISENYVASGERDTTGHGTKVIDLLLTVAPDSSYKPMRIIADDKEFKPSNFLKAMDDILDANIDVVNISAGKYHHNCAGQCRICEAVDEVVRDGSVVVAGAGNRKEDKELDVFCPARSSESIAVGMSETLCTITASKKSEFPYRPDKLRPPGAYWVDIDHIDSTTEDLPDDTYCGYNACSPFHTCENNRKTIYWGGNVNWNYYVPEVVAPGHKPLVDYDDGTGLIEPGTSYSTAVVSGGIATVLSEVFPDLPSPQRVKRVIEATSRDLESGIVGKFDMQRLRDQL